MGYANEYFFFRVCHRQWEHIVHASKPETYTNVLHMRIRLDKNHFLTFNEFRCGGCPWGWGVPAQNEMTFYSIGKSTEDGFLTRQNDKDA